ASRPTSGFCNNVPKQTEFIKTAQWRMNQCRQAGLGSDNNCQNLFTPVRQFSQEKSSQYTVLLAASFLTGGSAPLVCTGDNSVAKWHGRNAIQPLRLRLAPHDPDV